MPMWFSSGFSVVLKEPVSVPQASRRDTDIGQHYLKQIRIEAFFNQERIWMKRTSTNT